MRWDQSPSVPEWLEMDLSRLKEVHETLDEQHHVKVNRIAKSFRLGKPHMLLGTDVWDIHDGVGDRFNAAIWVDGESHETSYYAKNHLVMFGEYIPLLSSFPSAMKAIGMGSLSVGIRPMAFSLTNGTRVSPSVCFEDVVPHLIQRQVAKLTRENQSPDILINISNDGWFRGSSILDHQLNNAILVAVENRRPVLISSNTGLTAWIDGNGRVVKKIPRMEPGWILAEPIPDGRSGVWQRIGDAPAKVISCLGVLPFVLLIRRKRTAR